MTKRKKATAIMIVMALAIIAIVAFLEVGTLEKEKEENIEILEIQPLNREHKKTSIRSFFHTEFEVPEEAEVSKKEIIQQFSKVPFVVTGLNDQMETYYFPTVAMGNPLLDHLGYTIQDVTLDCNGCYRLGPYIICAVNGYEHHLGKLVEGLLGTCIVCDYTAKENTIEYATNWGVTFLD